MKIVRFILLITLSLPIFACSSKITQTGKASFYADNAAVNSGSFDFNGVDFGPILQDLRLIRQNGRIRTPNGTYYTVDSDFSFTPSQIRWSVTYEPESFLRRYFRGPWPNFH